MRCIRSCRDFLFEREAWRGNRYVTIDQEKYVSRAADGNYRMKDIDPASVKLPGRSGDRNSGARPVQGGSTSKAQPMILRTALAFAALLSWGLVFVMVWQL
jgi:hypothetical protein